MGTQRFQSFATESFRVTRAWFPAGSLLDRHTHDRATLAVMLRGGFRTDIARRQLACDAGCAWTEPLAELHANRVGAEGAHVVVLQPDAEREELLAPMALLFGEVHLIRHAGLVVLARRIAREMDRPDALRDLCIEALAVMLLADAARLRARDGNGHRLPGWLAAARDILHDRWRDGVGLSELAATAGVHPAHLARVFRICFGESVGTYVRKLRVEWAVRELAHADRPIAVVAVEAGFCDQSHFTRECKRYLGFTPADLRRGAGSRTRLPGA